MFTKKEKNNFKEAIDDLVFSQKYKFNYHKASRPSDTTSGNDIEYYVLDSIEKF